MQCYDIGYVKKRSGEAFFSFIDFQNRQPQSYRNPGHLASRAGLAGTWDIMAQIRDIPDNLGRVATLTHTRLTAFFQDNLGKPAPER